MSTTPRLLLVRHGETALNAARVLQPADTPLGERGRAQAEALARRLALQPPAAIWSSDLPRAAQTAEAIARACGLAVQHEALLRERDFGALRGRPYDGLGFDPLAMQEAPPGGESLPDFEARIDEALQRALAAAEGLDGALALVTHGLVIRSLLARQVGLPPGQSLPTRIGNTSLTVLAGRPPLAQLVDCTAHLETAHADDPGSLSGA